MPVERPAGGAVLHSDNRCYNRPLTVLRAPTEHAHALLGDWRALDRITACPLLVEPVEDRLRL